MKSIFCLLLTGALLMASPASAQNPPATDRPNNSAVNTQGVNNSTTVAGANSFTEGQAKSKIEDAGYTNVTSLKKDDSGVWRGKASKGGSMTDVSVDFQGNVNPVR